MKDKCPLCGGFRVHHSCITCGLYTDYWPKVADLKRLIEELEKEIRNLKPERKG